MERIRTSVCRVLTRRRLLLQRKCATEHLMFVSKKHSNISSELLTLLNPTETPSRDEYKLHVEKLRAFATSFATTQNRNMNLVCCFCAKVFCSFLEKFHGNSQAAFCHLSQLHLTYFTRTLGTMQKVFPALVSYVEVWRLEAFKGLTGTDLRLTVSLKLATSRSTLITFETKIIP